jgi:homocysteine S-methyltransferase
MGTMLHSAGVPLDSSLCELNVTRPALVRDLHAAYFAAGARLVQTNTFDANRLRLARFGLEDRVAEINIAGARLAREAIGDRDGLVAGSVGPAMSASLVRRVPAGERVAILREQVAALADWVDVIVCETFGDTESLAQAVEVAFDECDLPVVAQLTFGEDGRTLRGEEPAAAAAALDRLALAALGANCTVGPAVLREVVPELVRNCTVPVSVQPNAGSPRRLGHRLRYAHNTEYFAQAARQFVADGAAMVGGCCGTTPAHIRAVAGAVDGIVPAPPPRPAGAGRATVRVTGGPVGVAERVEWPFADRFVVLAGLRAPRGSELGEFIGRAGELAAAGADVLAVTDPGPPPARVNPIAAGALLGERVKAEVLLQVETADRSLPALQADLLGAHALGLRLVVCRTGTPRVAGDYPGIGPASDVDSVRLVAALSGLNDGVDWRGVSTPDRTRFVVGAALRTAALDRGRELARAGEKVAAGAHFLLTDVIYDVEAAARFLTELRDRGVAVPVVLTLAPFEDVTTMLRRTHEDPEVAVSRAAPSAVIDSDHALAAVATLRDLAGGVLVQLSAAPDADAVSLVRRLCGPGT